MVASSQGFIRAVIGAFIGAAEQGASALLVEPLTMVGGMGAVSATQGHALEASDGAHFHMGAQAQQRGAAHWQGRHSGPGRGS